MIAAFMVPQKRDFISRDDAKIAAWTILEGMGVSAKHNERLAEEVDAVVDDIPAADVRPVVRWTLCEDKQPPTGRYLVLKKYFGGDFGYDVCSYAEDLSKIDKYDFPKRQYKGIGGWFDYDSETGYFQTSVYAWMPLPTAPWFGAKMEGN